jgi:NAD(P)-dependent dehydrogenase (short-subunit alcohol dehydrogenase family)
MSSSRDVVVVTGASAGVGRAIAHAFGRRGHGVALLGRAAEPLEEVRREVEAAGGRGLALPTDVASAEAVEAAAERVEAELGPIAVWVNNAMVTVYAPASAMRAEEYAQVTAITYLGIVHGTLSALRRMRPRDRGLIIQIGSALAYAAIPLQSAYCAAKFAARGFTDSIRAELRHDRSQVRVSTVHLPAINTPQFVWARSRLPKETQPVPPIFAPEVAADAVLFAADHRWREVHLGGPSAMTILGSRLAPGLLERHLSKAAWEGQQTDKPASGERIGNLEAPATGHALRGPFEESARGRTLPLWVTTFPLLTFAVALLLVLVVVGLVVLALA